MLFCIILFILIIWIIFQVNALLGTLEFQESAKHKDPFALYNCLVLGHTKYNGVQRVFMAVIAWTLSWFGHRVSIMAPLWCHQILSGMLWFCCCSQHLLQRTLDPSPSNVHLYRRWKHMTILRMVIVSIITLILYMWIMLIISIKTFQVGWNLSVPWSCTSSTTRNLFSTSFPLKVSWENCW